MDGASLRAGELQAGTGTSAGEPGKSGSGRDDRRGTARTPARALASHPGTASERDLQAATGETGIHTQAGRGKAQIGHSHGVGPICPAGGRAGVAAGLGSDVLRTQLRVSPGAFGASGGRGGSAADGSGPALGG